MFLEHKKKGAIKRSAEQGEEEWPLPYMTGLNFSLKTVFLENKKISVTEIRVQTFFTKILKFFNAWYKELFILNV